jgi:hypothetical protein
MNRSSDHYKEKKTVIRPGQLLTFAVILLLFAASPAFSAPGGDQDHPIIPQLTATPTAVVSTVPANSDQNPYGVAFVPREFRRGGPLHPGDILVSNFNDGNNAQGTGTTIVSISPDGTPSLFYTNTATPGLSTALGVLKRGLVLVGNVPSLDGSGVCTQVGDEETDVGQGALAIINRHGHVMKILTSAKFLNGPWDLAVRDDGDHAKIFVADALSGTVSRIDLRLEDFDHDGDVDHIVVEGETQIASGYQHVCNSSAFVLGPTGVALDQEKDILYVASTGDNAIFAIHDASDRHSDDGLGKLVTQDPVHLHGPLGLLRTPNGDLISAQGDAVNPDPTQVSELVEFTAGGKFVAEVEVDPNPGGAFGLALKSFENGDGFVFAAVDDNINSLEIWVVH